MKYIHIFLLLKSSIKFKIKYNYRLRVLNFFLDINLVHLIVKNIIYKNFLY